MTITRAFETSSLARARQMADQRASAQQVDREALLSRAREYAIALADGRSDSPSPEDIIELCDLLNLPVTWMDCIIQAYDARREYSRLTGEADSTEARRLAVQGRIRELATSESELGKKIDIAHNHTITIDGDYRPGVTLSDLVSLRDLHRDIAVARDERNLLQREVAALATKVEQLRAGAVAVDPGTDESCGRECPEDFRLPQS